MKLSLRDGNEITLPSEERGAVNMLADLLRNGGRVADSDARVDWQDLYTHLSPKNRDAVASSEIRPLLQSSMEVLIREPIEPLRKITGMFTPIQARGLETKVLAGALGAVTAGDIPEHGTYPEVMFQMGGALQTAFIGKSGIAASFTEETLRYSTMDIMAMNLRLMRSALLRHKEQKAAAFLRTLGTELYNNATPSTSLFGVTTGRGIDGAANASFTMDDLLKGMAHMADEGFMPNILLMNPLFYFMFTQDPVLRNMMMAHGGGEMFSSWTGEPGPRDPYSNGSMGAMGPSLGNQITPTGAVSGGTATGVAGREHGMTAAPVVPGYFPWPFKVVVSPLVPFDAATGLGDIYLLSSGDVGFHLIDEEPTEIKWEDPNVDVVKVKLRERYAFAVAHEGQGVGVYKNVKLDRNYWDGTVSFGDNTGLAAIPPASALV
jgi:hypothetical protein